MHLLRSIARPLLSSIFLYGGLDSLRKPEPKVAMAKPLLDKARSAGLAPPADDATLIRLNGAVQVGAGFLLATSRFPRVAALVLAGSLVPTTLAGHNFLTGEPEMRARQRTQFAKNMSIMGGLLLAAADTGGRPSIAWRINHAHKPDWVPSVHS